MSTSQFPRDKSGLTADIEGEAVNTYRISPYFMEAGLAKTKAFQEITPHQRRQQIIDILSQTLAGQLKSPKKPKIKQKSSQKALA